MLSFMFFCLLAVFRLGYLVSALPALNISANAEIYVTDTITDETGLEKRVTQAVSRELLDKLIYYSEYTAAAYCGPQQGEPGKKISCGTYKTCPNVEKSDTKILSTWIAVGNNSATGFVAVDNTKRQIVLSMRGSVSLSNWIADIKYFQTDCSENGGKGAMCSIGFLGFWEQSRPGALKGIEQGFKEHPDYQLVVTGHSLGGAAAVYAASEFRKTYKNVLLYTYGQPRAGNTAFSQYVTAQGNNFRVTHTSDAVPKLPPEVGVGGAGGEYKHISPEYWISDGVGTKPEKIMVLEGLSNENGNTGTGLMKFNIIAHIQYFQAQMYSCVLPIPNFFGYDANTRRVMTPEEEKDVAEIDSINEEINIAIEANPDMYL